MFRIPQISTIFFLNLITLRIHLREVTHYKKSCQGSKDFLSRENDGLMTLKWKIFMKTKPAENFAVGDCKIYLELNEL